KDDLEYDGFTYDDIYEILTELEFRTILNRLHDGSTSDEPIDLEEIEFKIVDEVTEDILTNEGALQLEMITENYHEAKIEAVGIVNETGNYVFSKDVAVQSDLFIEWLEDEAKAKYIYDVKAAK